MTLSAILIYGKTSHLIMHITAVTGTIFLLTSIWAIYDLANRKAITREQKSSLTFLVIRWPIYGVIWYLFKIRKTLPEEQPISDVSKNKITTKPSRDVGLCCLKCVGFTSLKIPRWCSVCFSFSLVLACRSYQSNLPKLSASASTTLPTSRQLQGLEM